MSCWLFAVCLFLFVQESPPTAIESAMLEAVLETQEAIEREGYSEVRMHKSTLEKAKRAVIKPDIRPIDKFGAVRDGVYYMPSKKIQAEAIAAYRDAVNLAQSQLKTAIEEALPILDCRKLRKGQAGFLGDSVATVAPIKVVQVISDSVFLGSLAGETILFKDASLENVVDGKFVKLLRAVEVIGTEKYTTVVGGSNTVFCVRLIPKEQAAKALQFVDANKRKWKKDLREWKGIDGNVIVVAEYVSQEKGFVIVADEAGEEQKIAMAKLCKDDRAWLKNQ